jgi:Zn finger protein HypA/HybF involved in hydrogenase expression
MHEMSLIRGLLKQIDALVLQNGSERATLVCLKFGPWAHIESDHWREHLAEGARGTTAEDARLEIETTDDLHELTLESVEITRDPGRT